MFMRVGSKSVVLAVVGGLIAFCLPGMAAALTVGAYIGKSAPQPEQCFSIYGTGVKNTCSGPYRFEIPLAVNQGTKTATVEVWNSRQNDTTFQCTLYAASSTGSLITGSTQTAPYNNTNRPSILSLSVAVPASGTAYVYCNVNSQGIIRSVTYNH